MNTSNDDGTSSIHQHGTKANSALAIDGLLNGIKTLGFGADCVDNVFKHVFEVASGLVCQNGKEEDIMVYLEEVVEYIQKTSDLARSILHCHFLLRIAQVLMQQKHTEKAQQYFYRAEKIAASRLSEADFLRREIGIWENLISIHDTLGEKDLLLRARKEYLKICEPILKSPPAWLGEDLRRIRVGVARACFEIGSTNKNEEPINVGIRYLQEALRLEKDKKIGASESGLQSWILLQLSEFYYSTDSEVGQCVGQRVSWDFLQQAIAGLQQVECTCSSDSIDSSLSSFFWDGKGVLDCACHQFLADAYLFQGGVLQHHGFMVEAQTSFELGLKLVGNCNDPKREAQFHLELAYHLFLKTHMYTNSGLTVEESPHYTKALFEEIVDHYRDFLKKYTPGVVFVHDQMETFAHAIINAARDPNVISDPNGFKAAHMKVILEQLQVAEERGDNETHAVYHECLSVHYYRMGDLDSFEKHYNLFVKYLEDVPPKCLPLRALQTLGWLGMGPNSSNLQLPYEYWEMVFQESVKLQEVMIEISEDHALRYFELSKHACMALARCQMLREKKSKTCPDCLKPPTYVESTLVWAERGKGRMLMSLIKASTQSTDVDPVSPCDTHSFLTNDTFALNFICNVPQGSHLLSQSGKMIFIEYTFLSYHEVMIHLIVDDPCLGRAFVQDIKDICLHCELPEDIRHQAEIYFNESLPDYSEAAQSSTDNVALGAVQKILSAMNKYSTNSRAFNPWIPGMVAGIQKHVRAAINKLKDNPHLESTDEKAAISELLRNLFKVLIKPIEEQLAALYKPGDTLVFVPHEDLSIVPFGALHESDGSRYLIEDYAICVSPSIWCTRHCQHLYEKLANSGCDEEAVGPVLVGKKSGYPKPNWKDLKQAHKEVDAVAEAMRSVAAPTVLKDTSSDELSQARMMEVLPRASWIHLSVHGEVSSQFPQGSLLFSDNDNQRLTAEQIMTLAQSGWRARAVVVSACQTGLGAVAGGGILGFARAFILAGVPSSVLTVWEAPATFCTAFMRKLYEQLALGYSLAHAMQKVMKVMIHAKKPKVKGEARRLKWTIFDWACLSCFGFHNVTLPYVEQRVDSS